MISIVNIYCRSAADGPETSAKLEAQENACRAYCETQGLVVGKLTAFIFDYVAAAEHDKTPGALPADLEQ